ncbi:hypothetical protein B0T16DRAFT_459391 [Cercophora newfieldiana]|uniref:F-box domain-containing protein n=1 Tax=Cercophora newfieldiana TaxID=92897 RepID=A0AA40CLD8_9PEZI|nr:hypothetical protein B0T16DRAFT_459391 [Cercophora newfieldiana]
MASPITINSVPNEILISILSFFPSRSLLPLSAVSHRFSSVILRILRQRLVKAASLPDHRLILECYHPADKLSTPYLYCDYLWTDGIDDASTKSAVIEGQGSPDLSLSALGRAYSHFCPVKQEENRRGRRRYPRQAEAQDDGQGSTGSTSKFAGANSHDELPDAPADTVYLDQGELFSQLCTVTNLVKLGPKPGLFLSHINVNDGLIRVWRDWLAAQATDHSAAAQAPILWADTHQTVGVRFRVQQISQLWENMPLLMEAMDEPPVIYRLVFEELVVRSGRLLLMVEASEKQEVTTSGKAIVIASM